jgi:hypothetical protein
MRAAISADRHIAIFGSRIAVWYRLWVNAAGATIDAKQREQEEPVKADSELSHREILLSDLKLIGGHVALRANLTWEK